MIGNGIRIGIRHVNALSAGIVGTPVDYFPAPLDHETGIRHHGEHLIFIGYTQEFTVFTIKFGFSITSTAITDSDDFVIRELDEVILFVIHYNALGTLVGEARAVESPESSDDGAFVAQCVEVRIAG